MNGLKNIYTCFPGGKHKALTFSFDDGRKEDRRLVELFNQYGIKGTFNLNSGLQDAERIPAGQNGVDELLLALPETAVAEAVLQYLVFIHRPFLPLKVLP